jgi:protein-tyrosine phosphatase
MLPLIDIHCHLLAGLDDGPQTMADAVAMCRMAYDDGVRMMAATAHQNEEWPANTPDRIRAAAGTLAAALKAANVPLAVFPSAEVMVQPEIESLWSQGHVLGVGDRRQYMLVEMPHGLCVDLRALARRLRQAGVRVILAHPEQNEELLHEEGAIEDLISEGCLVQVSARNVTAPRSRRDRRALRNWCKRGVVHLLGSDGHSLHRRPPGIAAAYRQIAHWCGHAVADRLASTHGLAVLQGLPLEIAPPKRRRQPWFSSLWRVRT